MDIFNIIAGVASIISLIISLITFDKVIKIKNSLKVDESMHTRQSVKVVRSNNSDIKQAGRDLK